MSLKKKSSASKRMYTSAVCSLLTVQTLWLTEAGRERVRWCCLCLWDGWKTRTETSGWARSSAGGTGEESSPTERRESTATRSLEISVQVSERAQLLVFLSNSIQTVSTSSKYWLMWEIQQIKKNNPDKKVKRAFLFCSCKEHQTSFTPLLVLLVTFTTMPYSNDSK